MPNNIITNWLDFAIQQMAAESYLDGIDLQNPARVIERLTDGNNNSRVIPPDQFLGKTRFTDLDPQIVPNADQITGSAQAFVARYQIKDQHANDASGFSATLLFDTQTNSYTLSFRSTEYQNQSDGGDYGRDALGADLDINFRGFAFGQLVAMEDYYAQLKASGKLPAGATLNVTGYSLGGHLATVFTELHSNDSAIQFGQTVTFNGIGRGHITGGTEATEAGRIAGMLQLFRAVLLNPDAGLTVIGDETAPDYEAAKALHAQENIYPFTPFVSETSLGAAGNLYSDARYQWAVDVVREKYTTSGTNGLPPPGEVGTGVGFNLITQLFGHATSNDSEYVANRGVHGPGVDGPATSIFIEDQPNLDGLGGLFGLNGDFGTTHSITLIVDTLVLMEAFQTVDPNVTQTSLGQIFSAASNQTGSGAPLSDGVAEGNSLENALDALRKVFLGNVTPTNFGRQTGDFGNLAFRNPFYQNIADLTNAVQTAKSGGQTFQITPLTAFNASTIANAAETDPDFGIAYRYALKELNPFTVLGANLTQTEMLYAQHNVDGALGLESEGGLLTAQYLKDRAEFLGEKVFVDVADKDVSERSIHFVDRGTPYEITTTADPDKVREFVFGSDASELDIMGNSENDQLYGAGGDDTLTGNGGNDYLEGDTGNDLLEGGTGYDTYVYRINDNLDTINDSDGRGRILYDTHAVDGGIRKATDQAGTYHGGAQGAMTYVWNGAGTDLTINNLITVQNFQNGNLGIRLTTVPDKQELGSQPTIDFGNTLPLRTEYFDVHVFYNFIYFFGTAEQLTLPTDGTDSYVYFKDPQNGVGVFGSTFAGTSGFVPPDRTYNPDGSVFDAPGDGYLDLHLLGGNDFAIGGPGNDRFFGDDGNDELIGDLGNDQLFGGAGDDFLGWLGGLYLDPGDDYLDGGDENDALVGGLGNDVLLGGTGDDQLFGDFSSVPFTSPDNPPVGQDWLDGGDGNDTLVGGGGDDILLGGDDNDHLNGDALDAALSEGFGLPWDVLWDGNDWLDSGAGDDILEGGGGNDTLLGGIDNDTLNGGNGDDVLDGGAGNDLIVGGAGTNVILFGRGSGQDTVNDAGSEQATDIIQFAGGVSPGDVTVREDTNLGLVLSITGTTDQITLSNFFSSSFSQVIQVAFADGTVWGESVLNGPGVGVSDVITAGPGNNMISAGGGDDTIIGGAGNDTLDGGRGNDTYVFNLGDGTDTIIDTDKAGEGNVVAFGNGIAPGSLSLGLGSLLIKYDTQGDAVHIENFNPSDAYGTHAIDTFQFADGTVLSYSDLISRGFDLTGTEGNDAIMGTNVVDRISGFAGNDTLAGRQGDDVLNGGTGNDTLDGGASDDTYVFNLGDGVDTIHDASRAGEGNSIRFGAGVTAADLTFTRDRDNHTLTIAYGAGGDAIQLAGFGSNTSNGSLVVSSVHFADGSAINMSELFPQGTTIFGTDGDEVFIGTSGDDIIDARGGADQLDGGAGDDLLIGGAGDDALLGGAGNDVLIGDDLAVAGPGGGPPGPGGGPPDPGGGPPDPGGGPPGPGGGPPGPGGGPPDPGGGLPVGGGQGNDLLIGGAGNDLYVLNLGDGVDIIQDVAASGEGNSIVFGDGITPASLTFTQNQANHMLTIAYGTGGDAIQLAGFDPNNFTGSLVVGTLQFADGSLVNMADLYPSSGNTAPMVANPIADRSTLEDARFTFVVPGNTFRDLDVDDSLTYGATRGDGSALPGWLAFNTTTRTFSGTPDDAQVGTISLKVTATDTGGLSASSTFGLTITNGNDAPTVAQALADQSATEDAAFSFVVPAATFADVDAGDTLTYSAALASGDPLPTWLSFDAQTGTFSGTPANGDVGSVNVTVTATDSGNLSASDTFALAVANVNDAPTVANALADQTTAEDAPFSFVVPTNTFADEDLGDAQTLSASLDSGSPLPGWLSFDANTRMFSGTPGNDDVGSVNVTVTATDIGNLSASNTFGLTVVNVNDAPTVALALADQNTLEDAAFSLVVPADTFADVDAGDTLTLSAMLADGSPLPAWLTFDATTQLFSGTPGNDDVGSVNVTVTATDIGNLSASNTFGLTVVNVNDAPTVTNLIADQTAVEDAPFSFQTPMDTFADVDAGDVLAYSALLEDGNALPGWLSFDAATRTFSGTPSFDDIGAVGVMVTAMDNGGLNAADMFALTVRIAPDQVVVGTDGDDVLKTSSGNDVIDARGGNDMVATGRGNDTITGGTGNDLLNGGAGNDTYIYESGGGLDQVADPSGVDTVSFGAGISFDNTVARLTTAAGITTAHLRLLDAGGCELPDQGMDIPLDAGGVSPIERFAFANGTSFSLSALAIQTVITNGTNHDDVIRTGRQDDTINTFQGWDTVFAGSGNDTVYAGNGGDSFYGEGGDDALYGGNGKDLLDGGCGNDLLSGGNGKDTLIGGLGNDTLLSGLGDDTLQGSPGDDTLDSGGGSDTILFGRGDGQDSLVGRANNQGDDIKFGPGIAKEHLWFMRDGNDLVVSVLGASSPSDQITVADWYLDKKTHVKEFETSDGHELDEKRVDQLIQAMAQFSTDNGLTWDQAIDQRPQDVQTILAASWN